MSQPTASTSEETFTVDLAAGAASTIGSDVSQSTEPRGVVEPGPSGWTLELQHLPADTERAIATGRRLVEAAAATIASNGGGTLHHWARGHDELRSAISAAAGMTPSRDLWQMRRDLPVSEAWDLDVRPFVVGQDEAAWLDVNNRAFAWHPEQGHRTREELEELEQEPWFDPAGFLLHEVDGRLTGFCWTKVHAAEEPPLGEIYVIAVDPSAHKRGLGRQLVLAGLDHLHRAGLGCGMLYVEATNDPATRLYRDLGFHVHRVDTAHTLEIPAL